MNNFEERDFRNKSFILVGGFGEKKSNGGTQWYQQERIYSSDGYSPIITTCCLPWFLIYENTNSTREIK